MNTNGVIVPHDVPECATQKRALAEKTSCNVIVSCFLGVFSWPRRAALWAIGFYRNVLSPLTPPSCFFYPTCSHYTYQAIERFGLWRGGWLGLRRVCRCHPLARGGYDPVPEQWEFWPRQPEVEPEVDSDLNAEDHAEKREVECEHKGKPQSKPQGDPQGDPQGKRQGEHKKDAAVSEAVRNLDE